MKIFFPDHIRIKFDSFAVEIFFLSLTSFLALKYSQYKNDAIQLKNFIILKLPPFAVTNTTKEKRQQF